MPRPVPQIFAAETSKITTRPLFFLEIEFSTLLRLSSRGNHQIEGDDFTGATLDVKLNNNTFTLFNEEYQFSQFITEKAPGRAFKIWQSYGEGPFTYSNLLLQREGVIGNGEVGREITYSLKRGQPKKTPFLAVNPPTFNHLITPGTVIETRNGNRTDLA